MKLNNKGFVTSAVLYSLLILFITILLGILALFSNRKMILDKLKGDIKGEVDQDKYIKYVNLYMDGLNDKESCSTPGLYFFDKNYNLVNSEDSTKQIKSDYYHTSLYGNALIDCVNDKVKVDYACFSFDLKNYNVDYDGNITNRSLPCIVSDDSNLVINGDLSYKSNLNFSDFTYEEDGYLTVSKGDYLIDDYIPVSVNNYYGMSFDIKGAASATASVDIVMYDKGKTELGTHTIITSQSISTSFANKPSNSVLYGTAFKTNTKFIRLKFKFPTDTTYSIKNIYLRKLTK